MKSLSLSKCAALASVCAATILAAIAGATTASAQTATSPSVWTTLGTQSGPIAGPTRSQPANLLRSGDQAVLIDAGDGAAEQLARAGVQLETVHTVLISHLHFDHTGSLFAILGMRFQTIAPGHLTIYGPPGTKQLVDGLIAAMQPMADANAVMGTRTAKSPASLVTVIEITDGAHFTSAALPSPPPSTATTPCRRPARRPPSTSRYLTASICPTAPSSTPVIRVPAPTWKSWPMGLTC